MRARLKTLLYSGEKTKIGTLYETVSIVLIVISLIPLAFKKEYLLLLITDKVCAFLFCIDYILRWITADYNKENKPLSFIKYPFSFMAIIDLLSILPSVTPLSGGFKILRVARMFRALRVLRVIKAVRFSKNIEIILKVLRKTKEPLVAVGSLAVAYILISALIIINVEPDSFKNYYDAVYWATVSLTTMGYGDIYPVTAVGRLFTMISSVFGIAIVALPSGIITAGYIKEIEENKVINGDN